MRSICSSSAAQRASDQPDVLVANRQTLPADRHATRGGLPGAAEIGAPVELPPPGPGLRAVGGHDEMVDRRVEPVLLVVMGVVIAGLLLALYMPLFQLSSVLT